MDKETVRAAKIALRSQVEGKPWYGGIGISGTKESPTIRLNVIGTEDVSIPPTINGVRVDILRMAERPKAR